MLGLHYLLNTWYSYNIIAEHVLVKGAWIVDVSTLYTARERKSYGLSLLYSLCLCLFLSVSQMLIRSRGLLLICVGECAIFLQLHWDASLSVVVMLASRARLRLARPLVRGARARSRGAEEASCATFGRIWLLWVL